MVTSKIGYQISFRYLWLIKLINLPLVFLGFKGFIPSFCIKLELVKGEPKS